MRNRLLVLLCLASTLVLSQKPSDIFVSRHTGDSLTSIKKTHLTIEYDLTLKGPLFVHYMLYAKRLKQPKVKRTPFHMDEQIRYKFQNGPTAYSKIAGPYDKGHLAPDDDFRYDYKVESEAMTYTNAAPQQEQFNRGVWKAIENFARGKALTYDSAMVYTGVIYSRQERGKRGLLVPSHFFKIVNYGGQQMCFLGKNEQQNVKSIIALRVDIETIKELLNGDYERILKL